MINFILIFLFVGSTGFSRKAAANPSSAKETITIEDVLPQYDELDGLALAEALVRDGHFQQAQLVLRNEGRSAARSFWLAEIEVGLGNETQALAKYNEAEALLQTDRASVSFKSQIQRKRALVQYKLESYSSCETDFSQVQEKLKAAELILWSECALKQNKIEESYRILQLSSELSVVQKRIQFLIERGLIREAELQAQKFILESSFPIDCLTLAELFKGSVNESLLEIVKVKFPTHPQVLAVWGQKTFLKGETLFAAEAFEKASLQESHYSVAAAEIYRSRGEFQKAQYLAKSITNDEAQLKIKVSQALDQQRYSELLALTGPILRSPLQNDQDTQYALFYSHFTLGQKEKAQIHLRLLKRPDLLSKSQKLMNSAR